MSSSRERSRPRLSFVTRVQMRFAAPVVLDVLVDVIALFQETPRNEQLCSAGKEQRMMAKSEKDSNRQYSIVRSQREGKFCTTLETSEGCMVKKDSLRCVVHFSAGNIKPQQRPSSMRGSEIVSLVRGIRGRAFDILTLRVNEPKAIDFSSRER